MVNVHVNWLNWFLFLILVEGSLVIGCSLGEVKVGISPTFFIPTTAFLSAFYLFQVTPCLLVVFSIAWNESEFKKYVESSSVQARIFRRYVIIVFIL